MLAALALGAYVFVLVVGWCLLRAASYSNDVEVAPVGLDECNGKDSARSA